jgi:transposase
MIVQLYGQGLSRDCICSTLHVGPHRVSRVIRAFQQTGIIPEPTPRGPRKKVTKAILDYIDLRTLQQARLPSFQLASEIRDEFQVSLGRSTVAQARINLGFRYQPPRHIQELKPHQIAARIAFCRKLLDNPSWLPLIHFSDESRFVLGDDKRWVWYRRGEQNESAMLSTQKFPPSVMIFGVIGIDYKSDILFVEGSIDADKYI